MLSIHGCDNLEVPVALAEVEGAEPGGSLEVPVALAKVEGAGLGGSLEVPVALAKVERAMSSSGRSSIWNGSSFLAKNVVVEFVGEPLCEQFLYQ